VSTQAQQSSGGLTTAGDIYYYKRLSGNNPNYSDRSLTVIWLPLDSNYARLRDAFTAGVRTEDDTAWLLEGKWAGGGNGTVTIQRVQTTYHYHRSTSDITWNMLRTKKTLAAEQLMTLKDMESHGAPSFAIPQLITLGAKKYLKVVFSEESCQFDGLSESDGAQAEFKDPGHVWTGRVRVVPRDASLNSTFLLKLVE
jgi:hypothetical protein